MGQAKLNREKKPWPKIGDPEVTNRKPIGTAPNAPPLSNTGGKEFGEETQQGNPSATDRNRVNLSVPAGLYAGLAGAADVLGMTVAQAALMALTTGLPALAAQARAVRELSE